MERHLKPLSSGNLRAVLAIEEAGNKLKARTEEILNKKRRQTEQYYYEWIRRIAQSTGVHSDRVELELNELCSNMVSSIWEGTEADVAYILRETLGGAKVVQEIDDEIHPDVLAALLKLIDDVAESIEQIAGHAFEELPETWLPY
jgi:hypothetical protein